MKIYEGSENYVFISYSHKNASQVLQVAEQLYARGYRIWYDDGITPGSEWPEIIARHLVNCTAVLAFITPEAVVSDNCRREITFALARKKPFISIFLNETELPLGLELQLSAHQNVKRSNFHTDEAFINRICQSEFLSSCKQEQTAPAPVDFAGPEAIVPNVQPAMQTPVKHQEPIEYRKPVDVQKPSAQKSLPGFPRKAVVSVASALVLAVGVSFALPQILSTDKTPQDVLPVEEQTDVVLPDVNSKVYFPRQTSEQVEPSIPAETMNPSILFGTAKASNSAGTQENTSIKSDSSSSDSSEKQSGTSILAASQARIFSEQEKKQKAEYEAQQIQNQIDFIQAAGGDESQKQEAIQELTTQLETKQAEIQQHNDNITQIREQTTVSDNIEKTFKYFE